MGETTGQNWLDYCKSLLRRYPKLYNLVTWVIAPCYLPLGIGRRITAEVQHEQRVINLGAGTFRYGSHVMNFDIQELATTDCVADAHHLPIGNNLLDRVICFNMLEHVAQPQNVIDEIYRVLKPGGKVNVVVPFLFGFHAAPYDFHRWTGPGLREDFSAFRSVRVSIASGPTSSLLAILHEWLAILFSFNQEFLYRFFSLFFMVTLSPFKFLDLILANYRNADVIACTFLLEAEK